MMTIEEMRQAKFQQGLTYDDISRRSGIPAATVQKILGGFTKSPRAATMQALEKALKPAQYASDSSYYDEMHPSVNGHLVRETAGVYRVESGKPGPKPYPGTGAAVRYPRQGSYTVADRNALPDDWRTELIDGVIYDMAAPTSIHQILETRLAIVISNYIDAHGGECMCFIPDTDVHLGDDDKTVVMPDVLVVCDRSKIHQDGIYGAPDLVIEILSPSTQKKDMTVKLHKYADVGVREYWIVDPKGRRVIVYRLDLINREDFDSDDNSVSGNKGVDGPDSGAPGEKVAIYGFNSVIPVGIYGGDLKIDFGAIYEKVKFLYGE